MSFSQRCLQNHSQCGEATSSATAQLHISHKNTSRQVTSVGECLSNTRVTSHRRMYVTIRMRQDDVKGFNFPRVCRRESQRVLLHTQIQRCRDPATQKVQPNPKQGLRTNLKKKSYWKEYLRNNDSTATALFVLCGSPTIVRPRYFPQSRASWFASYHDAHD